MIEHFKKLNVQEIELMFKTPLLVSILIAGADGNIDRKEITEAVLFVEKQTQQKSELTEYFNVVAQDFEDKMKILMQEYPNNLEQRNSRLVEDLSKLNTILPKLSQAFSSEFYAILKRIAHQVAASSGGILGMNAIDDEEEKYIELYMIENPTIGYQ